MINNVTAEQIQRLDANQLTRLLLRLLYCEHWKYKFPDLRISVPENINTSDGGEDGRITCSSTLGSQWVIDIDILFQGKASIMSKAACKKEVLTTKGALKPQVKDILEKGGTYLLFINDGLVKKQILERIAVIREAIAEAKIKEGISEQDAKVFAAKAKVLIYDSNLIKDWTNHYIASVSYVQYCTGGKRPLGLITWDELQQYHHEDFKSNKRLNGIIANIRNLINDGEILRIQGPSGIGKSRLLFEVFNPGVTDLANEFTTDLKMRSDSMVYFDVGDGHRDVLKFIKDHSQEHRMILVLDDCPPEVHEMFVSECMRRDSNLQLVSLDFEPLSKRLSFDSKIIDLKEEDYKSVTEEILKEKYKGELGDGEIRFLIDFSEGNSKMAQGFAEASLRKIDFHEMVDNELVEKLVFGRGDKNEEELQILKILAAFKTFDYPLQELFKLNPKEYERLEEGTQFISNFFDINANHIYRCIEKYIKKGNIERRGTKIIVRPNPLALKLAMMFWEETSLRSLEKFIQQIPHSLKTEVTDQLQNLRGAKNAKELVEKLWGIDGNFSTAEILNSSMGSQLFRSVVIVNPEATTRTLVNHYLNKPKEELEKIKEGRQNLVWALEKLCFRQSVFYDAARVLMCFAVAENEFYYSNNATSYLKQLFSFQLAGTEVSYTDRIPVLRWALERQDPDFDKLCLEVCSHALNRNTNHRMLGAENDGSATPLKDYHPQNMQEVHSYIEELLAIVKPFLEAPEPLNEISQKAIVHSLTKLDHIAYDITRLQSELEYIIANPWNQKELLSSLNLGLHRSRSSKRIRELFSTLLEALEPKDLSEKIKRLVSEPYDYYRGRNHEEQHKYIEALAEEIDAGSIDLVPYFQQLLTGTQYEGFYFGKCYGKTHGYDECLVVGMQEFYLKMGLEDNWNAAFIRGYVSTLMPEKQQSIFDYFVIHESMFAFLIFQELAPTLNNASDLIRLVDKGVSPQMFRFSRREMARLPLDELISLLDRMDNLGEDVRSQIIKIVYWYIRDHQQDDRGDQTALAEFLKSYVTHYNALEYYLDAHEITGLYEWEQVMLFILNADKAIAEPIAIDIVSTYQSKGLSMGSDHHIANVANATLQVNFDKAWPVFGEFLSEDGGFLLFSEIFDMNWLMGAEHTHPFFQDPKRLKKLEAWLVDHKEVASRMTRYLPLYNPEGGWFSLTKTLIDAFGGDKEFLEAISSNLHSMSTVGSRVPFLHSRVQLLKKLLSHPIRTVQIWTSKEIEGFEKEIKLEKIRDEEEGIS